MQENASIDEAHDLVVPRGTSSQRTQDDVSAVGSVVCPSHHAANAMPNEDAEAALVTRGPKPMGGMNSATDLAQGLFHPGGRVSGAPDRASGVRHLAALDGSCRTPIAALAEISGDGSLRLRAQIATTDGLTCHETERSGSASDAVALGHDAGAELKARGGVDFFSDLP